MATTTSSNATSSDLSRPKTRKPFQPITRPVELPGALYEIEELIENGDTETAKPLIRSVVEVYENYDIFRQED